MRDKQGKEIKVPKFYILQKKDSKELVKYPLSRIRRKITPSLLLKEDQIKDILSIKNNLKFGDCINCPYGKNWAEFSCYGAVNDGSNIGFFCMAHYHDKTELELYEVELNIKKIDSTPFMPNGYKKFERYIQNKEGKQA